MNNVHEKLFKEIKMIQEEVVYTIYVQNIFMTKVNRI